MIEFLLKASLAIGLALFFYKLLLEKESFFAANRYFFVGCLVLAFALPFITLPKLVSYQGYFTTLLQRNDSSPAGEVSTDVSGREKAQKYITQEQKPTMAISQGESGGVKTQIEQTQASESSSDKSSSDKDWLFWLVMLYLFGVVIFSFSLLSQVGSLFFKIFTALDKIEDKEVIIINTTSRQAPFSFFNYVFICPDNYDYQTYEQIIAHEKIHARLGHSFDLLIAEIALILLWFNPLIYFLRREIEKNIEYQTDSLLLEKEQVSKQAYQVNLLQIATPNKPLNITTNYNQSLLKQRIMMMNAKKSSPHAYWKYSFLLPVFFGAHLLMNEPATSMGLPGSNAMATTLEDEQVNLDRRKGKTGKEQEKSAQKQQQGINSLRGDQDMSTGYWYSHQEKGAYCIEFKGSSNSSHWNMSRCLDKKLFQKKESNVFLLTKQTGTLQLTGALEEEVSQGKYAFTEDAAFKKYLTDNNIVSRDKNFYFHLFFSDVDRNYVDFLKGQYKDIEGQRLLEIAIHNISLQEYQNYQALFQKYSNKKPSIKEVVEAKIHEIDLTYVEQLAAMGYQGLTMKKMMEAKIHDVDQSFVEGLKQAGFTNLSIDQVIEAKIHDIDPATVTQMQALGFGKLSLDKIKELKIHEVNATYIKELQSAGLKELTLEQILEAKIHDLSPSSIKEIQALGFKDLTFKEIMSAQIHEVDAAYLQDLQKVGFANLSVNKAVEAKIHEIDGNFIRQAKEKGYDFTTIDKYISLKIHGMALESLKENN